MKKRIFSLLLCISMLCGVLSGCGSSDEEVTEKEAEDIFGAYAEYYNQFCSEHTDYSIYGEAGGINTDNYKMYDGAAKVVLEDTKPLMVIADLISINLDKDTWIFDLYFYDYINGKVEEKTVINNIESYDEGFIVKSIDGNVYLFTASGVFVLTDDSYELVDYGNSDFNSSLNSISHREGDFYYYSTNFVDYVMEEEGSCKINQKINCLSGEDFTDYLTYLQDKSFKNVCELDALHRDFLVENRYCDDFNLWYEYKEIPLVYYSPEEDELFFNLFLRSTTFKKDDFSWDKPMLIPCIHEMTSGEENDNYDNFNMYDCFGSDSGRLNYINECLSVELPEELNGINVLTDYFSNELGTMKNGLEERVFQDMMNTFKNNSLKEQGEGEYAFLSVEGAEYPFLVTDIAGMVILCSYQSDNSLKEIELGVHRYPYIEIVDGNKLFVSSIGSNWDNPGVSEGYAVYAYLEGKGFAQVDGVCSSSNPPAGAAPESEAFHDLENYVYEYTDFRGRTISEEQYNAWIESYKNRIDLKLWDDYDTAYENMIVLKASNIKIYEADSCDVSKFEMKGNILTVETDGGKPFSIEYPIASNCVWYRCFVGSENEIDEVKSFEEIRDTLQSHRKSEQEGDYTCWNGFAVQVIDEEVTAVYIIAQ